MWATPEPVLFDCPGSDALSVTWTELRPLSFVDSAVGGRNGVVAEWAVGGVTGCPAFVVPATDVGSVAALADAAGAAARAIHQRKAAIGDVGELGTGEVGIAGAGAGAESGIGRDRIPTLGEAGDSGVVGVCDVAVVVHDGPVDRYAAVIPVPRGRPGEVDIGDTVGEVVEHAPVEGPCQLQGVEGAPAGDEVVSRVGAVVGGGGRPR